METDRPMGLEAIEILRGRLEKVREDIAAAARLAGRLPSEITLVGVSKFHPAALAQAAVDLGLQDLGENRVQEMVAKMDALSAVGRQTRWHLIGTLQRNKVKYVVGRTELIHSVDSLELIAEISRVSEARDLVTQILLQVNTAEEVSKHGFGADQAREAADAARRSPGIHLRGLMTMAPLFPDPDMAAPVFSRTQELFLKMASEGVCPQDFNILSMGMSTDYWQAIACGSTHVRIGTAIFGPRL